MTIQVGSLEVRRLVIVFLVLLYQPGPGRRYERGLA
jgi:hypothetical protein